MTIIVMRFDISCSKRMNVDRHFGSSSREEQRATSSMAGLGSAGLVRLLDEHRQLRAGLRGALQELDRFHAGLEALAGGASFGGHTGAGKEKTLPSLPISIIS